MGGAERSAEQDQFLDHLLTWESGIDPDRLDIYREQMDAPAIEYWKVERPGLLSRDPMTGLGEREWISIREYFRRLGVCAEFALRSRQDLAAARYQVINPWGFIGYQLGEAVLIDTGYYTPEYVRSRGRSAGAARLPSYYIGEVPSSAWAGGRQSIKFSLGDGAQMLATPANLWLGQFTGQDGVNSLDDLQRADVQERVVRHVLTHNFRALLARLQTGGASLEKVLDHASTSVGRRVTLSGCLAACHLCGVEATAVFLLTYRSAQDETGTTLESYLTRFSGYSIESQEQAVCGVF